VNPTGELIEVISRPAGLDNVGDVAVADPEPTGRPAQLADSVNPQTSPGPLAGMTPQDRELGEGVHVGG